jgi:phosphohistidine phosphatase SixA
MNARINLLGSKWLWSNALLALAAAGPAGAEQLTGSALVSALQHGGYVLVLHHASSPFEKPGKAAADPDNVNMERQLDEAGKQTSTAMGKAIETLGIPIGDVQSSRTFRAMQTAKYAGLRNPRPVSELTEGKQGMAADKDKARAAWLRHAVARAPRPGTNTVLITHTPNMVAAFGEEAKGIKAGETMVFHPDGNGGTSLVARVTIDKWPQLAAAQR